MSAGAYLRFWGVRGSIPTPTPNNLEYGGNTACIELRCGEQVLILDAGTGIRALGDSLQQEEAPPARMDVLFSHFHWDHIQGLPFFGPLHAPEAEVTLRCSTRLGCVRDRLRGLLAHPYFPVPLEKIGARCRFASMERDFEIGDAFTIQPFETNHPQGCTGFRIVTPFGVIVYASDLEHGNAEKDRILLDAAVGADVLIYDAQYTPGEHQSRRGWGHSTWLQATRVARQAAVRQLILFHHDPDRADSALREIEDDARQQWAATMAAREGTLIRLA